MCRPRSSCLHHHSIALRASPRCLLFLSLSITSNYPADRLSKTDNQAEHDAMMEAETRRRAHTIGESVTPAPDGSVLMPVCLLDMLLFPLQPVTLYLFEPR